MTHVSGAVCGRSGHPRPACCGIGTVPPRAPGRSLGQGGARFERDRRHLQGAAIFTEAGIFTTAVNNQPIVKIEGLMEADALRILRDVPSMTVVGREVKHSRSTGSTP